MENKKHLKEIYVLLEKEYKKLKEVYLYNLQKSPELKDNDYLIKILQNSKNLRSIFLFLLIKSSGREITNQDIVNGVAIEIFHTASLLHDDIVDRASSRRGLESVNKKFGYAKAAIIGDRLSLLSYSLLLKNNNNKYIHDLFFELIKNMSVSQLDEINNAYEIKTTVQNYIHAIKGKTGDFFLFIGYLATENIKNEEIKQNYLSLSANFGVLFQLKDDLIDIFSLRSGKERLNDFKNGKMTLPLIILKGFLNGEELFELLNIKDSISFYKTLKKYGIKEKADKIIKTKAEDCLQKINQLPCNDYTLMLENLIYFLCNREH